MANHYEEEETQADVWSITEFADKVRIPMSISISSSRNTGKTVMCSVLIQRLLKSKKVDMVLVMSQTQHVNDDYKFLPARLRQPFSEAVIKKLMDKQGKILKKKRDEILLVLDDVLSDKEAEKSRFVKKLYTLGRHYNKHYPHLTDVQCCTDSRHQAKFRLPHILPSQPLHVGEFVGICLQHRQEVLHCLLRGEQQGLPFYCGRQHLSIKQPGRFSPDHSCHSSGGKENIS